MGKGSARTLKYWLDKGYDKQSAEKMRLSRIPGTIEYFMIYKKMSPECAIEAKKKYQDTRKNTYENFIKRYGEVEGELKWQIYKEKQAYSNTFEYKQKKYGWSYNQFEEYNKKRGSVGKNNGNYGSSYYQTWIDKFGKDEADRMNELVSQEKARYGSDNGNFGREKRPEELKRMRKSAIKYIEDSKLNGGQLIPRYNKSAIPLLEQKAKELGITDLQHAENGGEFYIKELGYWVDGYSKEKNIVIEYYEKFHKRQSEKDKLRRLEIEKFLNCEFIIINEK